MVAQTFKELEKHVTSELVKNAQSYKGDIYSSMVCAYVFGNEVVSVEVEYTSDEWYDPYEISYKVEVVAKCGGRELSVLVENAVKNVVTRMVAFDINDKATKRYKKVG